ncbi:MAG: TonB-dependent receptor [Proteobacteria bacterium]|nr:TonB-dependent receptor [Pseudomonadota bacterium]MBU1648485.1 TonB-dependent receptor [Pseudomonadota bacterium]MBU1986277.1 TonB-dependent receptor [Pseudomonadota bacterium]
MNFLTRKKSLLLAALTATITMPLAVQAEEPVVLDNITVKGEAITSATEPITVNTISSEDIDGLKLLRPEQLLEQVPGVEIHNYNQGGVANEFTMRGYNNCGHGSDAAIAIDGISLNEGQSHADGYADMNVIIPLEIDHVDVFKGPSSPLFGNFARGGAVSFNTKKDGEYSMLRTSIGSYDTYDTQYAMGRSLTDTVHNNTALQFATTDGYQDHSSWQRGNFSTRFGWQATPNLDLALSFRLNKSIWDAPGYIPEAQFRDEEASFHQAVNAEDDGGDKLFTTQKLEAGYSLTTDSKLLAWTYATEQDFTRFQKMGIAAGGQKEKHNDRSVYGAGTSYNYEGKYAGKDMNGVAGIEYLYEDTDTLDYSTSNRVRTSQLTDRNFVIDTLSLFGQVDYALHPLFKPWLGLRYDSFGGDYTNRDPGSSPFSEGMNDYSHLSPKVGFHSELHNTLDFRTSFTQGFALPGDADKYNSEIGSKPQTINQYEVGLNFTPSKMFTADLAVFRIDNLNEIQETYSGSGIYEALGETRREGLELSAVVRPWLAGFEVFADLTVNNTEVIENVDPTLVGKEVKGVADYTSNLGVRYLAQSGINTQIKWQHVDSDYTDSQNFHSYAGYDVTDFSISYGNKTENGTKWRAGVDIDNLFDKHYSEAVIFYSSLSPTNLYAVSPPRTFWLRLGIEI